MRTPITLDPIWNENPAAALAEIERLLDETGELWSGTGYFRALEQVPRNIGKLTNGYVGLYPTRVADLSGLAEAPAIRTVHAGPAVSDIAVLPALPNLETFDAWQSPIRDLRPLAHHGRLKELKLNVAAIEDLSPLGTLPALETLILYDYRGQALPPLPSLRLLHLNMAAAVPRERGIDLSPLGLSRHLRTLIADGPVTRLPALPELRTLYIDGSLLDDLTPVGQYRALEQLSLRHPRAGNLGPLAACERLERIDVRGAPIRDIRPLARLKHLHDIAISGTMVEDIVPLSHLPRAREGITALTLDASDTPVSSLRGWNTACPLWRLNLSGTRVTDISPLAGSAMLTRLYLRGSPIADLTGLAGLAALICLDITGTQVSGLDEVLRNPSLLFGVPSSQDPRDGGWFHFSDTPVARSSPELAAIAAMSDTQAALLAHFGLREPMAPVPRPRQGWWRRVFGR